MTEISLKTVTAFQSSCNIGCASGSWPMQSYWVAYIGCKYCTLQISKAASCSHIYCLPLSPLRLPSISLSAQRTHILYSQCIQDWWPEQQWKVSLPFFGAEMAKSRAVGVWRWGFCVVWAGSKLNSTHITCVMVLVSLVWPVPSSTPTLFLSLASGDSAIFFTAVKNDCTAH